MAGFRRRPKSIRLGKGVRINRGKKGITSVSLGSGPIRTNINRKGTRHSISARGTGMSYVTERRKGGCCAIPVVAFPVVLIVIALLLAGCSSADAAATPDPAAPFRQATRPGNATRTPETFRAKPTATPRIATITPTPKPAQRGTNCHDSYPTVCIPPAPPDLDCKDVRVKRFAVRGSDPHGFDSDGDGVGCES